MQITTIGLDIAKNVFQVHGISAGEKVVIRKQLRRSQVLAFFEALSPCLIGMEACATAHYWARELTKLGHQVRLMPAKDVKAYVKRNKNDAADAEAICEAVRRPTMRFVQIKSIEQQGRLMLHRARDLLLRQRTQVINALRAHLAELGIVAAQGREGVKELLKIIASEQDARLPTDAQASLTPPADPIGDAAAIKRNMTDYEDQEATAMSFMIRLQARDMQALSLFMEQLTPEHRAPVRQEGYNKARVANAETLLGALITIAQGMKPGNDRRLSAAIRDTTDVWIDDVLPGDRPTILGMAAKAKAATKDDETKKNLATFGQGLAAAK